MALNSLLYQASELNEDAIFELSSGRSGSAIVLLKESAGLFMQCLSLCTPNRLNTIASTPTVTSSLTSRVQIPHLQDDLLYIYSCAVSFPALTDASSSSEMVFQFAVVLFNLALAYHQQGKLHSQSQSQTQAQLESGHECFQQALTYYKECQQALQSLPNCNDDDDDVLLLTLAVLNNQAQILYQHEPQLWHPGADVYQKLMTHSMNAIQRADETMSMVEQSQIHEFVQNAMVLRLEQPCAAPTA